MPKKDFPENKSIRARLEAVINSHQQSRHALALCKEHALGSLPGEVRKLLERAIDDAIAAQETASLAISGDE